MNGKHEFGCDCRDCKIFWAEDASSRALRTREFEPRLINNVESLVEHNNVQSWVDPDINQEGLDIIFGTRDAFNVPASGPISTSTVAIADIPGPPTPTTCTLFLVDKSGT